MGLKRRSSLIDHDISSPLSAQILEFCDPEFLETFQNSEVTSSSYDDNSSNYTNNTNNLSLQFDHHIDQKFNLSQENNYNNSTTTHSTTTTTSTTTTAAADYQNNINNNNLSLLFDPQDDLDNEISASIDFSNTSQFLNIQEQQFDFSTLQPQLSFTDQMLSAEQYNNHPADHMNPMMVPPLTSVFEDDCLSSVPNSYVPLNPSSPSCSYFAPSIGNYFSSAAAAGNMSCADNSGIFGGGLLQHQDIDFQGDNGGIFCHDSSIPGMFNPSELQGIGNENHQFVNSSSSAPMGTSDISCLEDPAYKVGKLSVEERREKIHRYMKKRNERNFSKKIKYACRKTLADSRPRVRGRFAKNEEFGETNNRAASSNHDEDDDDEQVVVKEEEEMVDSSDIFAHISGVNSFNCNYSIQSWI
ncbi:CCT motif family protein [Euphorbia peplus]|nr:CCT motif family protein [Euphorbia peplus]